MRFHVRRAGLPDLPDVEGLLHDFAVETGWPPRDVRPRIVEDFGRAESGPLEVWIAVDDGGEPVGFATAHRAYDIQDGPGAWLSDLYVRPEARRHGLARRLVAEVASWARRTAGATWLMWHTGPENEAGRRFYASLRAARVRHDSARRLVCRSVPGTVPGTDLHS